MSDKLEMACFISFFNEARIPFGENTFFHSYPSLFSSNFKPVIENQSEIATRESASKKISYLSCLHDADSCCHKSFKKLFRSLSSCSPANKQLSG